MFFAALLLLARKAHVTKARRGNMVLQRHIEQERHPAQHNKRRGIEHHLQAESRDPRPQQHINYAILVVSHIGPVRQIFKVILFTHDTPP